MKGFSSHTINVNGRLMDLSEPCVMGILNATPDSFFADSRKTLESDIAARARQIVEEGGDIIDVGAFSTRPGASVVEPDEETRRLRVALKVIRDTCPEAVVSVDTFRPEVARMAVEEFGVAIINDVSGGNAAGAFGGVETTRRTPEDDERGYPPMFVEAARLRVPYVLTSSEPDILTMIQKFAADVQSLRDLGMKDIILDPGFGFGKTMEQNYRLLANIGKLRELDLPIMVGASRKSMIYRLLGTDPERALNGTTVVNTLAMMSAGASILRVHDVRQCAEAIRIVKEVISYV